MGLSYDFDTINHNLLLAKLEAYGFSRSSLTLMKSFLYNKFQRTNVSRDGSRTAATSKVELFVIIVNCFQPLTIITKSSTLGVAAVLDPPLVSRASSDRTEILTGLGQGSLLGPLLLNVFLNDIFFFITNSNLCNYGGDKRHQ